MENFEDIKVGDKVIVTNGGTKRVETVERLTKSFVSVWHRRFRKKDGIEYGGVPFERFHLCKATPEALAEIEEVQKRDNLLNKVARFRWGKLSTEELEKVYEMINK